jgi:glycosyltransferase involved in cell wall biosynthesis
MTRRQNIMMNNNIKISVLTSLYRCEQFLENYFKHLLEINGTDEIEVLLLHNDPIENELKIINRWLPKAPFARHIIIPKREGLYSTWNRGIRLAQGEYITVWNVDDVRFPDSVLQQAEALDTHTKAVIAYGDIWVSADYGDRSNGWCTNSPLNNYNKDFFKQYHISCFQMWRKSIHETIGYYDEQFKCIADFDFQVRAALHFSFMKTAKPLGIYLDGQPHKLSSNGIADIERNVIYLRYGVYQYLNIALLPHTKKWYRQNEMLFFDEWVNFTEQAPFRKWYKVIGIVCACFSSIYWICKQLAKKVLYGK